MSLDQTANNVTNASIATGALTTGMTLSEWVTSNALIISMSCTIAGIVIALTFHIINTKINRNRNRLQLAIQLDKWESEGKTPEDIDRLIKMAGIK